MAKEPIRKITLADGSTRYRVVVDVGRGPDGSRDQRTSTHKTLREAREWLAKVRTSAKEGSYVRPSKLTLTEHLDTWLAGKRDLRPSTRRGYVDALKPFRAALGTKPLQQIGKADLDRVVTTMLTTGGPNGHGRKPRTVILSLVVLQQALDDAVRQGLLVRNVAALVERPRQEHHEMRAWTLAQAQAFLRHVAKDRLYAAWLLTLHGLRRGEVLGLRWSDVDLDSDPPTLAVRSTRVLVDAVTVEVGEPKTARGRRLLPLPPGMVAALRALKAQVARERLAAGPAYEDSGLVVVDELGQPLRPERYSDAFQRLVREAKLPVIRLHDARHTAASLMLALGYPVHIVAAWLGHDPVMTHRVYAHVHRDEMQALAEAFSRALAGE
jgi:integrase